MSEREEPSSQDGVISTGEPGIHGLADSARPIESLTDSQRLRRAQASQRPSASSGTKKDGTQPGLPAVVAPQGGLPGLPPQLDLVRSVPPGERTSAPPETNGAGARASAFGSSPPPPLASGFGSSPPLASGFGSSPPPPLASGFGSSPPLASGFGSSPPPRPSFVPSGGNGSGPHAFPSPEGQALGGLGAESPLEPGFEPGSSAPKPFPAPPEFPAFPRALCGAGLLGELRVEHLASLPTLLEGASPRERLDFLDTYYAAGSDPVVSLRRRATDRWFVYDSSQPLAGAQLVQRLTFVLPELAQAHLERMGGKHGTLLLRAGDHVCALDDDHSERGNPVISVGEIVRGMNMLMDRRGERVRLVGLVGDGTREAYVGVGSLTLALALSSREFLTARDPESLTHLTGWELRGLAAPNSDG